VVRENNWKLRGIVNGIDYQEWSPMNDPFLLTDGYTQYDVDTMEEGKRQCKVCVGGGVSLQWLGAVAGASRSTGIKKLHPCQGCTAVVCCLHTPTRCHS
jgi:hypothetical protein